MFVALLGDLIVPHSHHPRRTRKCTPKYHLLGMQQYIQNLWVVAGESGLKLFSPLDIVQDCRLHKVSATRYARLLSMPIWDCNKQMTTLSEIKKAHIVLAKKQHPDKQGGNIEVLPICMYAIIVFTVLNQSFIQENYLN